MIQQKLLFQAILILGVCLIFIHINCMKDVKNTLKLKHTLYHLIVNIGEDVLSVITIFLRKVGLIYTNGLLKKGV